MAAETKTAEREQRERIEHSAERLYNRAEENMGNVYDNSRRAFQAMLQYQRNTMETTMRFARDIQEESLRLTDAWFDQVSKYQRNNLSLLQDYNKKVQDSAEKTIKEGQSRMEDTLNQSMDIVAPAARAGARR